ncbi:MAG: hypothetical protein AAB250_04530 [Bdellovibrionota bacterium]
MGFKSNLILVIVVVIVVAGSGLSSAQTSTSGTASGSTAPNQLGTPLNGQTDSGTLRSTDASTGTSSFLPDVSTSTSSPTFFESSGTTGQASSQTGAPLYYLVPVSPNPGVPGYALPVLPPQQQLPQQFDGTVSGSTSGPIFVPQNTTPTPSPTP